MVNPKIIPDVRLIQKCLLVDSTSQVLVLRRGVKDHSRGAKWDFPGGGYELGEDVDESLRREVQEEAGLTLLSHQPLYFGNQINAQDGLYQGDNVFAVCHLSRQWEGEVTLSDEHQEFRWVTPEEALSLDYGQDGGFFTSSLRAYLDLQGVSS